jgi:hypothetical protein
LKQVLNRFEAGLKQFFDRFGAGLKLVCKKIETGLIPAETGLRYVWNRFEAILNRFGTGLRQA